MSEEEINEVSSMTLPQYLFVCLMEEASEVAQEGAKCLRFTPNHSQREFGLTNLDKLKVEFAQLCAVAEELGVASGLRNAVDSFAFDKKIVALQRYGRISMQLGTLKPRAPEIF